MGVNDDARRDPIAALNRRTLGSTSPVDSVRAPADVSARLAALEAENARLKAELAEAKAAPAGSSSLRAVPNPAPFGVWDVIGAKGTQSPIYRGPQAESLWQALDKACKESTGYLRGVEQTHFYNVGALVLALVPDLPERMAARLEVRRGQISDRNKGIIYEALWLAVLEGLQGIKVSGGGD